MVLLAALGMAVVSGATAVALPLYFQAGADAQLTRVRQALEDRGATATSVLDTVRTSSTASGTLFVRVVDERGTTVSQTAARDLEDRVLPPPDLPRPLPAGFGSAPTTVRAESGGRYRAVSLSLAGSGSRAVLAQSLAPSRAVIFRVLGFEGLVVVVALLGVALFSRKALRVGLLPLRDIAARANAIASGDTGQSLETDARDEEIAELGAALNRAFDARRRSEEKLRRFVADASHELRTPLTLIQGWAQLHTHGLATDPAAVERGMRRVEAEAARMHRMVEDLLLLARLDQEHAATPTVVDLSALVRDAAEDVRALHPGRLFEVNVPERLFVEGDEDGLVRAVRNLLANAVQHTPDDAVVEVEVRRGGEDTVLAVVSDSGPGMSPESAARVFERFYRGEPGRQPRDGGSGLGLSIVAAIVEAHAGTVTLDSVPGRGTTVTIRLPSLA
ncbi:sensor histidine kinase [Lentzea sp. NPDC059081]|uniref:sensor histidine kinase n=1 Tax=Lentzea sp. NPDC059081 TaxID=3346719 RepID=UPI003680A36C